MSLSNSLLLPSLRDFVNRLRWGWGSVEYALAFDQGHPGATICHRRPLIGSASCLGGI
jgi:hypothetical protein